MSRLDGNEARRYAAEHLLLVEQGRSSEGAEDYVCTQTAIGWVLDFPLRHWAEDRRGTPRLRRLPPGEDAPIGGLD